MQKKSFVEFKKYKLLLGISSPLKKIRDGYETTSWVKAPQIQGNSIIQGGSEFDSSWNEM